MEKEFERLSPPEGGTIRIPERGSPSIPDNPVIPFIEGDGIGPDIWKATRYVLEEAIRIAYNGERSIVWFEVFAGEKARKLYGDNPLPSDTLRAIGEYGISIKGPLTTPVSGGYRSLNVALRQRLDLYACIRPIRYIPGVPSPLKRPEEIDLVIFRENTEDVYAGIEWPSGSPGAVRMAEVVNELIGGAGGNGGQHLSPDAAIGIKPVTESGSKRLIRKAIRHAIDNSLPSVTLVHKGNIMKYTEGAFRDWGYELSKEEFGDSTVTENEMRDRKESGGKAPAGRTVIKDRIADAMFQQLLLRPHEYSVIATTNLNGDYLSDMAAGLVGGLGLAPGYNVGDSAVLFEAIHGTAPKYAGLDKVNPTALIMSGAEMLKFMEWKEAADLIRSAVTRTVTDRVVTYDLARQLDSAKEVSCSGFASAIVERMRDTADNR